MVIQTRISSAIIETPMLRTELLLAENINVNGIPLDDLTRRHLLTSKDDSVELRIKKDLEDFVEKALSTRIQELFMTEYSKRTLVKKNRRTRGRSGASAAGN